MSEPIVFISRFRVKAGKAEAYKELQRDTAKLLLADKPRTLVYLAYLTENSEQITMVHAFADSESMDLQFQGAFERAKVGFELFEPDDRQCLLHERPHAGEAVGRAARI